MGFSSSLGHGFNIIWANDFNHYAAETYRANFGTHVTEEDIENILQNRPKSIPEADVVIGGPPCQGFSLLNKKRSKDIRRGLWRPFLDVVELTGASVFLMENVPQLLGSLEYHEIVQAATRLGFTLASAKLCAADYGVAQVRYRAFILGCRFADSSEVFPPKKTHYNPKNGYAPGLSEAVSEYVRFPKPWRTVRDVIADLPIPNGTEITDDPPPLNLHFGRNPRKLSIARYNAIPKEGMNRFDLQKRALHLTPKCWIRKTSGGTDLFGRLWWDRPAFTIRTEFFRLDIPSQLN